MAAKIGLIVGACVALAAAGAATAHHSFGMFDQKKELTLEATVVEYRWKNPHTHLVVSVPDTILALTAAERGRCAEALEWLGQTICHQGPMHDSTVAAVPYLIELLAHDEIACRPEILGLL